MFGDLRNKVKGLKKKGGGSDDDTAEFEMGDDALDEFDEDFEDDETGDINPKFDDANKKKIRLAGIIVIILVGAYFAVDELVLKKEVVMTPPPLKKRPRPKKKPKKKIEAPKAEAVVKKAPSPVENKPAPIPTPEVIADAQPLKIQEKPLNEAPRSIDEPINNESNNSLNADDNGKSSVESSSSSGDMGFASDSSGFGSGVSSASGMGSDSDSKGEKGVVSEEGISSGSEASDMDTGGGAVGSSSNSINRQETPIEYISPPNYEALGRGLVYNCIKQHWACVNKENFFQCRGNAKWFESKNKASECMTDAVFATIDDCNAGQLQRINNNIIPRECYGPD